MSKFVLGLLIISICNLSFAAQKLHLYIEADEYGEYIEADANVDSEWTKTDDGFVLNKIIEASELPYTTCLYISCLKIKVDGHVSFGGFAGDYDAGAEAFFYIPRLANGEFFKGLDPYHFNVEGGEYASGLWSTRADIKIMILNE